MNDAQTVSFPELLTFLDRARVAAGMSIRDIEEQLGVDPGALTDVLEGRRIPAPREIDGLTIALGCDRDGILRTLGTYNPTREELEASSMPRDHPSNSFHRLSPDMQQRLRDYSRAEAQMAGTDLQTMRVIGD